MNKYAWHVHHDVLVEPLTEPIEVRRQYIQDEKPIAERMTIVVTGSYPGRSDSFWSEIEKVIGVLVGESDGRLTQISRPDNQSNYRDYGVYELTYTAKGSEHSITLEVLR